MYSTPLKTQQSLIRWVDQLQFVAKHPQFDKSHISYLMRNRHLNGLDDYRAVKKLGRKLYIHEQRFVDWFEGCEK